MIESMLYVLIIIAILLLILTVEWESMALCGLDIALWFVLAVSVIQVEIPYQYVVSGVTYESTQKIESLYPLSILFYGIAVVMMIYLFVNLALPLLGEKIKNRKML